MMSEQEQQEQTQENGTHIPAVQVPAIEIRNVTDVANLLAAVVPQGNSFDPIGFAEIYFDCTGHVHVDFTAARPSPIAPVQQDTPEPA